MLAKQLTRTVLKLFAAQGAWLPCPNQSSYLRLQSSCQSALASRKGKFGRSWPQASWPTLRLASEC